MDPILYLGMYLWIPLSITRLLFDTRVYGMINPLRSNML